MSDRLSPTSDRLTPLATDAAAARWVKRRLGSIEHETRVAAVAAELFELTKDLLNLTDADARLLRLAAITHDVGRSIDEKNHPEEGATLLLGTPAVDFTPAERRVLAFCAAFHRGPVPAEWKEPFLKPTDARRNTRAIVALLRVADALDSRRIASPRLVMTRRGRKLKIRCYVGSDLAEARHVYRRRKKFHLLEELLGAEIDVAVCPVEGVATV